MQRYLRPAGAGLAAASLVTVGAYFVAAVTSGHPQPWWPYILLLALVAVGVLGYLVGQPTAEISASRGATGQTDRQQIELPDLPRDRAAVIRSANGMKGCWSFGTGRAVDWSGHGNDLTLMGGAKCSTDRGKGILQLNGSGGYASSAWQVVQTDVSFTVMAWVKMSDPTGFHTAVSQDGNRVSGFFLQYSAEEDRWAFSMTSSDSLESVTTRALSTEKPIPNTWVHLAGVYDAAADEVRLYVNAILNTSQTHAGAWSAVRCLQVGRALWEGAPADFFPGVIGEVRVFGRALTAPEVASVVDFTRNLAANYTMDEGSGEISRDYAGGHSLVLRNAGWGGGFSGAGLTFDGSPAVATAPGFLDTSSSFSVAVWLRLGDTSDWRTAVSQDGAAVSGFFLQYSREQDRWAFSMLDSDSTDAAVTRALATQTPRIGSWQHLVGVHDVHVGQLRLYVDGQRAGVAAFRGRGWRAAGEFVVGRGLFGEPTDWFIGNIDQVRVWNRALTDADVSTLV